MRRGVISMVVASAGILAATASALPATASANTIGCANKSWTTSFPREQPSRCIVFRGNQPDRAHEIDLQSIHWNNWGAANVSGSAFSVYCCMGGRMKTRVKVRVYRLRISATCGERAYTRLAVRFGRNRPVVFRPPACETRLGG